MEAATLSNLADQFARDGYVVINVPEALPLTDRITAQLAGRFDDQHRIENAWRMCETVRELATLPVVLETLAALYGRPAFPFQTLNFDRGTEQLAHSDTIHFDSNPKGYMAGVWFALEDIDANNGPLRYYPGSHKLPQKTLVDFGVERLEGRNPYVLYQTHYEPGIAQVIEDNGLVSEDAHIKKGQALIWAANLLHGGSAISDPARTRHSQVTHYYFEGCSYHTPLLADGGIYRRYPVDIRTGHNIGGIEDGKPLRVPLVQQAKSAAKRILRSGTTYDRVR
ncbi:phytanoyl-CoA dioxygenase family protein [Altererythrobacter sp. Z27]|uniref:phytanoyl-CoA dioxygenase family protein n=1 Tax=Altererythrobacter sp. Z27 TaxID=3461147 RepID=UPI004044F422